MVKRKNQQPRLVENLSDDDSDEEIDEDGAFNSDDERKYGSLLEKKDNDDDEEEEDSEDDDEDDEDGDGGQYMLDLLNTMDKQPRDDAKNASTSSATIAHHVKESPFSSSVISSSNDKSSAVTLNALMEGLRDTASYGRVQKGLKPLARGEATSAPASRVVSERAKRKVHYKEQSENVVSEWLEAVQENRQAETLDFRPKARLGDVSRDALTDTFVPTTDFEKQLQAALEEAGQHDEEALMQAEEKALQDDLDANGLSMEEYKKRQGQLAKMRALMFYHEQKRHHMNKIKSKKYRRIRKKQREKLKEAQSEANLQDNPDLERELGEKEEMERMQERMTLAHKNTSKWAKRVLKRGKNVDVDTRRALSAQLKRGDDLLKRMNITGRGMDDDDSDEDLVETAKKVLADTDEGDDGEAKGLMKLSFMQRGVQRQREQAREEARQLLLELEENERLEQGESDDDQDRKPSPSKKQKTVKAATKEEMKQFLKDGEMVASSLKFGTSNSTTIQVSGGIDIDTTTQLLETEKTTATTSEHTSTLASSSSPTTAGTPGTSATKTKQQRSKKAAKSPKTADEGEDSNPWLIGGEDAANTPSSNPKASRKSKAMVDVNRAVDLVSMSSNKNEDNDTKIQATTQDTDKNKKITTLTQEELVRKAFAGTTAEEADEEFAREKDQVATREDPNRKKNKKQREEQQEGSLGWGSWTGKGAPPPPKPRGKLPPNQQPPKLLKKRKRKDDVKPRVILSERRVKRLAESCMLAEIPHPYKSREEYERATSGGMGREWNVTGAFKAATRPDVQTRSGQIIQPLSMRVKKKPARSAAKF
jgi:U3 small nucleolar RNA-associated protein 14